LPGRQGRQVSAEKADVARVFCAKRSRSAGVRPHRERSCAIQMRGLALNEYAPAFYTKRCCGRGRPRSRLRRRKTAGLQASHGRAVSPRPPPGRTHTCFRHLNAGGEPVAGLSRTGPSARPSPAYLFRQKTRDRGASLRRSRRDRPTVGTAGCPRACFALSAWGADGAARAPDSPASFSPGTEPSRTPANRLPFPDGAAAPRSCASFHQKVCPSPPFSPFAFAYTTPLFSVYVNVYRCAVNVYVSPNLP
jgi:hypothetical protein